MRNRGGGVGHKITWNINHILLKQDAVDEDDEDNEQIAETIILEQDQQGSDCEQNTDEEMETEGPASSDDGDSEGYADL